jgi:ceramide glucosyltransferase
MLALQIAGVVLFAASTIYLLIALSQVARFRERILAPQSTPAVTIMVPCHGLTPRLLECLRSICRQDYAGSLQVVFGLHEEDDEARPVIERLMAETPGLDAALVIDPRRIGTHPKNCNLANMMPRVRHDIIVLVDSDVMVDPHFLATLVATLEQPGAGAATCLYKALPEYGFSSRLGASYINDWQIPSGLVDLAVHGLGTTYGAAIAVTRQVLDKIGGFAGMASVVSSDYSLGEEVRRLGLAIRLAPMVVSTIVAEPSLDVLYRHEVRWMRAIRATRPLDHALWICSSALVPLIALSLAWPSWVALGALGSHLILRLLIHWTLQRNLAHRAFEPQMIMLREIANFVLWAGSFMGRRVHWGDQVIVTGGRNRRVE